MKYHFTNIHVSGQVLGSCNFESRSINAEIRTRKLLDVCHGILCDNLPLQFLEPIKFTVSVPSYPGLALQWHQYDPFGASLAFVFKGTPVASCWLLSGCQPTLDAMTVDIMVDCMQVLNPKTSDELSRALRAIKDRPAVIYFPLSAAPDEGMPRPLGELVGCLAAAFFDIAFRFADQIEKAMKLHFGVGRRKAPRPSRN